MNDLRPLKFSEVIGQKDLIKRLKISIASAKQRNQPLSHILLDGPAGTGKTTLAGCIAHALHIPVLVTIASILDTIEAMTEFVLRANRSSVIFIDEIHQLTPIVAEFLYPVLEDFKLNITCGLFTSHIDLPPLTFIGATTQSGDLPLPFRDRFPIREHLDLYTVKELTQLVIRNSMKLNLNLDTGVANYIAGVSRGTPRITNSRLTWIRDYAHHKQKRRIGLELVLNALKEQGIDSLGLDDRDRKIITTIRDQCKNKPVGLQSLATTTGISQSTIAEEIEPWLLCLGLLARTSRGRILTKKGLDYENNRDLEMGNRI